MARGKKSSKKLRKSATASKKAVRRTNVSYVLAFVLVFLLGVYFITGKGTKETPPKNESISSNLYETRVVQLNEQSGSSEYGNAVLSETSGGVLVEISLVNSKNKNHPAHVHSGSCIAAGDVVYPLQNVVNGFSKTLIPNIKLNDFAQKSLYINAHKSSSDLKTIVSCGNI